jgi:hypothetical protein
LYTAWKGASNDQCIHWSSFDRTNWSAPRNVPGVGASKRPALAVFSNHLYMAWKGASNDQGIHWTAST